MQLYEQQWDSRNNICGQVTFLQRNIRCDQQEDGCRIEDEYRIL